MRSTSCAAWALAVPFILVTGSLGEEAAVDCVKRGAADYVIKDRLARLPVAVRRALEQQRLRHGQAVAVTALEASEQRYRELVENSSDAILLMSDGRWTFANQAAVRLFGAARAEDLVGRPLLESVAPAVRDEVHRRIEHSVATGEVNPPIERRLVRLDGSLVDVDVLAIPVTGPNAGAQVIMRDITSRKQMEDALKEREERFRQITENIREAFYMVKADLSELLYVSPAYEAIVGRPREEVYRDLRVVLQRDPPGRPRAGAGRHRERASRRRRRGSGVSCRAAERRGALGPRPDRPRPELERRGLSSRGRGSRHHRAQARREELQGERGAFSRRVREHHDRLVPDDAGRPHRDGQSGAAAHAGVRDLRRDGPTQSRGGRVRTRLSPGRIPPPDRERRRGRGPGVGLDEGGRHDRLGPGERARGPRQRRERCCSTTARWKTSPSAVGPSWT